MSQGRVARTWLAGAAVCAAVAACTGSPTAPPGAAATPGTAPPASAGPGAPSSPGALRIAVAGDIHFERQLRSRLADPGSALEPITPILADADLTLANLETAIATGGTPQAKDFTFRAPPQALDAVKAAGVDVVTMANNHAADYGAQGLRETLDALAQRAVTARSGATAVAGRDLAVVGVGPDARTAYAPVVVEAAGRRVGVVGASSVDEETFRRWTATDTNPGIASVRARDRVLAAVREVRGRADVVIVYMHWGIEGDSCPSAAQRSLARALTDAGADVVVGTHTHLLLGAGYLPDRPARDAYVAYGLGNFVFYARPGSPSAESGVLTLTLDGRRVVGQRWTPARIDARGLPVPLQGGPAAQATRRWEALRGCTDLHG